jgi:GH18 family chitinase
MRIKHFAGYGSIEAKKVSKTTFTNEYGEKKTKLVVRVKGNHEWGLVRDDIYDVKRWLFDKFEKNFLGEDYEISMSVVDDYVKENGLGVEVAVYTFVY